ncbi:C40 family peptidase [Streptomyces sannanensis]|uniref:C40 family peptidase n=1 Tax=Streptomyces sannanensis TaxID=285536 RepID=UPI0031E9B6A1
MAAHRKPRQHPLTGNAARTAVTLALAGVATGAFEGAGHASPGLTPAQVKARLDKLYHDAEIATERYNGTKEQAEATERSLDALRDEAARRTEGVNAARDALGSIATAQYRAGAMDPAVQLAFSPDPDRFLDDAALAERAGARQSTAVAGLQKKITEVRGLHATADRRLAELRSQQADLRTQKADIQRKIAEAERLLARLSPTERAAYESMGGHSTEAAVRADRGAPRAPVEAAGPRAVQAVAYAYEALGKPYIWGATGPYAFDCSGLTQAAWRSAGVSLPRTTYTQISAGTRVSRSELVPGDLVFFYSGISHVGLYIGDGKMIHAPRPGAPVRIAPIDQMPFAGASRPV